MIIQSKSYTTTFYTSDLVLDHKTNKQYYLMTIYSWEERKQKGFYILHEFTSLTVIEKYLKEEKNIDEIFKSKENTIFSIKSQIVCNKI